MKKTKDAAFDCVEMMHRGALRIYKETKHMTVAQKLAYWKRKTEALSVADKAIGREMGLVREPPAVYRTGR